MVLSEFESNSFGGLLGEGITTVSFFSGDRQAAAVFLKDRLAQVAAANPWMVGHLVKEKRHGKRCALRFSREAPAVKDAVFQVKESLSLSEDTQYSDLVLNVNNSGAKIPAGTKLLNTPQPVSKLTVACADGGFALIFSVSHVVCNGGTYYQLLNMLSAHGAVVAMDPTRQEAMQDKVYEYMGRAH